MKKRNRICFMVGMLLLFSIFAAACGKKATLSEQGFIDTVQDENYKVADAPSTDNNQAKVWKIATGMDNTSLQYVEFDNASAAENFFKDQADYIQKNYDKDNTASRNAGIFTLSASGWYYYVQCVNKSVVIATSAVSNRTDVQKLLDKIPGLD